MFVIPRVDQRHLRAAGVLGLLFLLVLLGGAATHVVERGETLGEIARDHGTTVRQLAEANDISNPDLILIGQELIIPGTDVTVPMPTPEPDQPDGDVHSHTVVRGDVLARIAQDYGVSVTDLIAANSLDNPDLIPPRATTHNSRRWHHRWGRPAVPPRAAGRHPGIHRRTLRHRCP